MFVSIAFFLFLSISKICSWLRGFHGFLFFFFSFFRWCFSRFSNPDYCSPSSYFFFFARYFTRSLLLGTDADGRTCATQSCPYTLFSLTVHLYRVYLYLALHSLLPPISHLYSTNHSVLFYPLSLDDPADTINRLENVRLTS